MNDYERYIVTTDAVQLAELRAAADELDTYELGARAMSLGLFPPDYAEGEHHSITLYGPPGHKGPPLLVWSVGLYSPDAEDLYVDDDEGQGDDGGVDTAWAGLGVGIAASAQGDKDDEVGSGPRVTADPPITRSDKGAALNHDQPPPLDKIRLLPWWVALAAVCAVLVTIVVTYVLVLFQIPDATQSDETFVIETAKLRISAIRYALTAGAGAVGILALLLAFHRQRQGERQQQHKELESASMQNDAQQRRITELRIKAVEQLGSESPAVRIGGLHNLERLGDLHPELRQIVLDEICAYLRMPRVRSEVEKQSRLEEFQLAIIGSTSSEEQHVRLVAQEILQRHLNQRKHPGGFWEHTRMNLSGAVLDRIDFNGAELRNADFAQAKFIGRPNFEETRFVGNVVFTEAKFMAGANFFKAIFEGSAQYQRVEFLQSAVFSWAHFRQDALFMYGSFGQDAEFTGVEFDGRSYFNSTRFETSASFKNARFDAIASFHSARVKSVATFENVEFESHATFMEVYFGSEARFKNAKFTASADTSFNKTVFCERSDFENTSLRESEIFSQARFNRLYTHTPPSGWNMLTGTEDPAWGSIQMSESPR
ncbi:pentapeptide repeat-containing protein [Glycomyces tritici]|uniref:Pentapeptide repeat-containing protein n=1 Tax=Glycomyces tritici TaxID=2665176 RepID=A0ABT7YUS8_9ACTN|nr:pentapeptide repeat-containing protein [Glycomyces tritici]MDN3241382.1 pentapeptide repeat-containing protein [Glycomyces tritici]MDN3242134.1 pentapeptide repeat-containing protein [Glycomyces tritici]